MRWLLRTVAATAAIGLAAAPAVPAHAAPGPRADQWWFRSWSIQKEVWPVTKGKGVTVAVIDTGVNAQLPDMKPVVLPGTDLTGKGGDGRRDNDSNNHGHGTGMASLIASQGTKTGFVGIAPEAKILPIAAPSVSGPTTAKAVRYAVDNGAKVVNISESSESAGIYPNQCPPELLDAVKYAAEKDVVIVASAGNSGDIGNKPNYPASCPGVVAVGAFGHDGKPWKSTQRQPYVTVAAPGADVGYLGKEGHAYNSGAGTSQASALASGAIALVRSRYPEMSARQVVQRITATAKDFGPTGKDDLLGYGVISIPRALKQNVPDTAPNPVYERLDKVAGGAKAGAGATKPAAADKDDSGGFPILIVGGVVVVLLVLGVGGFLLMRGRKKPAAPSGPAPMAPPQPFGAPGPGPQQGPPPGGPHNRPPAR
ncbi:type VII secretion-associated serine protease mycosin [Actinomadura geliboluensis]|uniref:type VII secretion-associated serine protease mycosin n=1 Tax=Actinomadura geliboluensis TaxID=882440 RepID=UPI00262FDE61|nr:type VII secretion-associated serine protease mycosin [Actinomadura geliboluensis]